MKQKLLSNNPRMVPLLPSFVYGAGLAFLLFGLIRQGWLSHPMLDRYIMAHPVSVVETVMFSIGMVALALKAWQLRKERQQLLAWETPSLAEEAGQNAPEESGTATSDSDQAAVPPTKVRIRPPAVDEVSNPVLAQRYLNILGARPSEVRESSISRRISDALQYILSRQSAQDIDVQLKHLAGREADAQHDSYSLIRLMVWAIPMLGFLGTVLGISEALGGLNLGAGADLSALITNLKSSLYVAFDTTAIALSYGVVLMFIQFALDRMETANIDRVDSVAEQFVLTNFQHTEEVSDSPARSISRMGQALLRATFSLVEHQHELWNESLTAAQEAWVAATENSTAQSEALLQSAMTAAGQQIADRLTHALGAAETQLQHRAQQWQVSMSDNTRVLAKYQENAATHVQLLDQFFQQCSHLSKQQQDSITQLISSMDRLMNQNQEVQNRWQDELVWQHSKQEQIQSEMESLVAAHANEMTRQQALADARLAAEVEVRLAAEQRALAEAQARQAAEELGNAEAAARREAEQQREAADAAKRRAEELARAANVARKLVERQWLMESENRQLQVTPEAEAVIPSGSTLSPTLVRSAGTGSAVLSVERLSTKTMGPEVMAVADFADQSLSEVSEVDDSVGLPPVDWHAVPRGTSFSPQFSVDPQITDLGAEGVNSEIRSSVLPFPDAKIYRAA